MKFYLISYLFVILAGLIDIIFKSAIKRHYARQKLLWSGIPNFWKDWIPEDHWYRIRYAYVLNGFFTVVAGISMQSYLASILYLYFTAFNHEHIWYQWLKPFGRRYKRFFNLPEDAAWLETLIWNSWLAQYQEEDTIMPKTTLTFAFLSFIIPLYIILIWR